MKPRLPLSPLHIALRFSSRAWRAAAEDDLSGTAAQMTYYFMLALFPSLILLVALIEMLPVADSAASAAEWAGSLTAPLPEAVSDLLSDWLTQFAHSRPHGSIFLWVFVALWAASRGVRGARKGLNRVFRCPPRHNYFKARAFDLVFTAAALVIVGFAYLILVGGAQLGHFIANYFSLGDSFHHFWSALRWPVVLCFLGGFLIATYRYLPGKQLPLRRQLAGALPALGGWIAIGLGFRYWLSWLGHFDELYGSLASFFILMVLLWLVSLFLLVGGKIAARK
ncbi:MAG: YihY/virulence factor BrkB family protein [Planctomycetes bacterium]|jgi:membrane protein|nr:YihY/virulence factor BrkB family protein [Planctomycetota bacterium]MBT4029173.1 YihY/virulence factor BrkB family protein [Planctomycetota bacterium]MBT4559254.1 YihY/virulence factor BrkB family protein [Planctomycetota bacterium]MBT5100546.1 YihY/virulence factor BrkB family protein [Planctomycetota bacterium]MBT5119958.1 YihY/virulence factor BrkB family protein [Planctomycetota bacterium]